MKIFRLAIAAIALLAIAAPATAQDLYGTLKKMQRQRPDHDRPSGIVDSLRVLRRAEEAGRLPVELCMRVVETVKEEIGVRRPRGADGAGQPPDPHSAARQRHDRHRVRLDHQQPHAAAAGRLPDHLHHRHQAAGEEGLPAFKEVEDLEGKAIGVAQGTTERACGQGGGGAGELNVEILNVQGSRRGLSRARDRPGRRLLDRPHPAARPDRQGEGPRAVCGGRPVSVVRPLRPDDTSRRFGVPARGDQDPRRAVPGAARSRRSTASGSARWTCRRPISSGRPSRSRRSRSSPAGPCGARRMTRTTGTGGSCSRTLTIWVAGLRA